VREQRVVVRALWTTLPIYTGTWKEHGAEQEAEVLRGIFGERGHVAEVVVEERTSRLEEIA
jgi:hypothetical protein